MFLSMGNCFKKYSLDPNKPHGTIQPPAENLSKNKIGYPLQEIVNHVPTASNLHKKDNNREAGRGNLRKDLSFQFQAYNISCFCYTELEAATKKFRAKNLLGQGGFGDVYKGCIKKACLMTGEKLNRCPVVAVKRLKRKGDGHSEWQNELNFLSKLNHPNVVKLVGYCIEGEHRLLVYEYMCRGSLEAHLLKESNPEMTWSRRIKIALGAARGLKYLHECQRPVIHRDVKASNVLLDADFNPKLSDFGLATFGPQGEQTHVSTRILGTTGYFAPEYVLSGHLTLKSDVYSFGVVLLEIFCGSGAIKRHTDGGAGNLAEWAKPDLCNIRKLRFVIDQKLRKYVRLREAYEFAQIINRCLSTNPKNRPTMSEVVADLEKLQKNIGASSTHPYIASAF